MLDHIVDDGERDDWLAFMEKHADRLIMGSDIVGGTRKLGTIVQKQRSLLLEISESAAQKIAYDNADALYWS